MADYADLFEDDNTSQRAGINLRFGIETQPDVAAQNAALAKRYGLPTGVIEEYKPEYETRAKVDDGMVVLDQSPKLRGWLAAEPDRAKLVHDDISTMGVLEKAVSGVWGATRAVASGVPQLSAGLYGAAAAPFELAGADGAGRWLREQQRNTRGLAGRVMGGGESDGFVRKSIMSGFQSAGQNLVLLPLGLANTIRGAGEAAMLGVMGATTGGESYGKARDAGVAPASAAAYGIEDGVVEGMFEKAFGAAGFLKNIKAGASAGKLFTYELAKELPGEMATTLVQNFNEWATVNPDKSVVDFLSEQPAALAQTAIATLVGGGTQIGAVKGLEKLASLGQRDDALAQTAEQHAQVLESMQATMQASKLLERSPDTLRSYAQDLVDEGVPTVYVDSSKLVEAGIDLQALAQTMPSVAAQLDQVETGGDLAIPTGELLTNSIGTEFAQPLIDHARTDVNGMSRFEATVYMQEKGDALNAEVERVMAEKENDTEFKAGRDAVQGQLLTQLNEVKRFTPEVNEQYATLAANFYAVQAARVGMTVQDFADKYKLGFNANEVAGGMYDQGGKLATDSAAFRSWFGDSNMLDGQGQPMVLYHGTNKDFTQFKASKSGLIGPGVYLGLDADAASLYDGDGKGGEHLMPVYARGKYIPHAEWSQRVQDAGGNWDAARKAAEAEGIAGVRDDHYENALNVWNPANIKSVFNRGTWNPNTANILHQKGIEDPKVGVSNVLLTLGQNDDLYQYPRSDALDVRDIAADKSWVNDKGEVATAQVSDVDKNTDDNKLWMISNTTPDDDVAAGTKSWILTLPTGKHATLTQKNGEVYINVSGVGEGNGGSAVYDLAANYALNNGLVFVGDPNGVSPAAMRRRLENMLSSAIKYGTTDHLKPHPDQYLGDASIGVPPLDWTNGDTLGNIRSMVDVSIASTEYANTEGSTLVYNPATSHFESGSTGARIGPDEIAELAAGDQRTQGAGQGGVRTLQRTALFKSLVQSEGARRAFLESVRGQQDSGSQNPSGALAGTFYQFAGRQAQGADLHALDTAERRLKNGVRPEIVRRDTGWFKGADGKMRFEINDADALFKVDLGGENKNKPVGRLFSGDDYGTVGSVLHHPALFAAYPALEAMPLKFVSNVINPGVRGASGKDGIALSQDLSPADALSTLLHEIQHGIQTIEGFASGGSPHTTALEDGQLDAIRESVAANIQPGGDYASEVVKAVNAAKAARYKALAGEVEARNVQTRQKFTDEERALMPAYTTQDVPAKDVIVVFNGKESLSAPEPANIAQAAINNVANKQEARGQIAFGNDITQEKSMMSLLKNADLSTFIHESGHFFLEVQTDLANRIAVRAAQGEQIGEGERSILDDMNKTLDWMGVKATPEMSALDHWAYLTPDEKRPHHEQWARGFEAYAFEGKAPSLDLQHTFQTFRAWLVNVYRALLKSVNASKTDVAGAMKVELSDEVRSVMDRMLATSDQIAEAEAARDMGPLFKTAEQAGMTLEEFKAYHDQGAQATMDAVDELQARGLRDMQWLNNARSRKLKELQKQHDALRAQVAREVRSEVMRQPIYRAWTFLTSKATDKVVGEKPPGNARGLNPEVDNLFTAIAKLGGLDRAEVKKLWGIDEKEKLESGVFGAPVVRKTGGLSTDAMAERLLEAGYLLPDEHGKADADKFEELFDDQRRGTDRYSIQRDMAAAYGDAPLNLPELPEVGFGKLRTEELRRRYGTADDAVWRKLSELRMTSDEGGLDPDVVGELFGFSSGDELVKTLAATEPPKSVIEGMTDTRMLQEHGDLATPAGLERAADAAIHNDARARFVATELKALQKAMSVREKVPGQKNTVDVLARAARDYATAIIAKLRVRDIRPSQYAAAEARSAKAAAKALGGIAQATLHKRNQLINLYATKAAYAAQDEVKAAVQYFKKFDTVSKALDPEYAEQIHALLERFDLRVSTSLKALDKRKSLVEWAQAQVDQGLEPDIPPELLQEANRKSFKDMTVEEVRGLRDTIKQIEHLGRLKNRLLTAQANRDFQAAVEEISASINLEAGDRKADTRTPNTVLGDKLVGLKNFWAEHIKTATWARIMDGGKDGGPVWEYLIRTANTAGDSEVVMREKATKELAKLVAPVLKEGKMGGKGEFFPSINRTLNKEAKLAIALNTGNESNTQRLLGGEGWSIQQLQPVLNSLSAADWQFVQAVWDHFETYRPAIGAKEKRVYGKEPNWVEPTPVQTPHGVLRGGYYPIKYDPRASEKAESHASAEDAKRQLAGAYTSATTRRSFTKSRVEEVNGRPLLYSLDGIYNGVQEVIHDLTWHEWLIDANKLVRNKKIAEAMRSKYGPDAHQQFKKWLEDNAAGDRGAQGAGEKTLAYIRQGVSVSGLGLNVMSALMQPLGITQSMVRIGPKWAGKGVAKFMGSPIETADAINEKSEFMRTRALTRLREINEVRSQVKGRTVAREAVDASAYFLLMRCQQAVDIPTWWGAYEKAIAEGNDENRAVALSDQAVIDAQGSGGVKDQSAIERGGPGIKLFTTFYSFFNTALNLGVQKTMNAESKAKLAADYLLLYSIPVILGAALKDALTPGDSGDWDDPEHILKKLIGEHLSFLFGLVVGVREVTGAVQAATGTAQYGADYSGPAGVRMLADFTKLGKQINQGELDDGLRKAVINTAGELLRLPAAQVNRTITGVEALRDGKTQNPGAVLTGYQGPK